MQHAHSDVHKEAMLKMELLEQNSVHALDNKQVGAEQKTHREMLLK